MKNTFTITLLLLATTSCVTYQYYDRIDAKNSIGEDVEVMAYWQATHRKLWYDTYAGAIRVKTQCSPRTLVLNERNEGIVFLWEPGVAREDGNGGEGTICGRVIKEERIKNLKSGPLEIMISCQADVDEFAVPAPKPYFIAPRVAPYKFNISRVKSKEAPEVAKCERIRRP